MKKTFTIILFSMTYILVSQETIETKFSIPDGFEREIVSDFHEWIIAQPLKDYNKVFYSDGTEKINYKNGSPIWAAVFDYDLGTHRYHQCADAAIYLNAMFKYEKGYKDQLIYSFTNGDKTSYEEWLIGVKYSSDPNNQSVLHKKFGSTREDDIKTFYGWLKVVWKWAGTSSLVYDTENVNILNMKPGDIFNQYGHAISVVDMIINKETGKKKYMLSQSYMINPSLGDEQHILLNQRTGDVWYDLNENAIITPEWLFNPSSLIRFK